MSQQHTPRSPIQAHQTRQAIAWYLRHKLLQWLEQDRIYSQKQIATRMGIPDIRLIQLKRDARGAGFDLVDSFARYEGKESWEVIREALVWWERGGKEVAERDLKRLIKEREERGLDTVNRKAPYKRRDSSERPSVRLVAAPQAKKATDGT